jgi:hypothetical protein
VEGARARSRPRAVIERGLPPAVLRSGSQRPRVHRPLLAPASRSRRGFCSLRRRRASAEGIAPPRTGAQARVNVDCGRSGRRSRLIRDRATAEVAGRRPSARFLGADPKARRRGRLWWSGAPAVDLPPPPFLCVLGVPWRRFATLRGSAYGEPGRGTPRLTFLREIDEPHQILKSDGLTWSKLILRPLRRVSLQSTEGLYQFINILYFIFLIFIYLLLITSF